MACRRALEADRPESAADGLAVTWFALAAEALVRAAEGEAAALPVSADFPEALMERRLARAASRPLRLVLFAVFPIMNLVTLTL